MNMRYFQTQHLDSLFLSLFLYGITIYIFFSGNQALKCLLASSVLASSLDGTA